MITLRKSLLINFAQNYGIIAVQFVSSLILARLLSPEQIGIYSVAATLIGLAQTIRDFGVGQYIVQEKELTPRRMQAAFGLALAMAATLATLTAAASGLAAEFYREPGVRNVMLVLAANFLLIPFGQITMGILQREMKFGTIALIKISSILAHSGSAVLLAYLGFGFMSLAWASLIGTGVSVLLATFNRPHELPWLPAFGEVRRVLGFGSFSVLASLAGAIAGGIPDLVIGRMMNMTAVGLFSRAAGLIAIFNQGVMSALWAVALPHFSKAVRDGHDIKNDFLNSAAMITGLAWPFFAVLALLGQPVILLLYGASWLASAPLVKWICLSFWLIAPFYLYNSVLIALGKVRQSMWLEVGTLPLQVVLYVGSASYGNLEMVAAASVAFAITKALVIYTLLRKLLQFDHLEFGTALSKSAALTAASAAGCAATLQALAESSSPAWASIALGGSGAAAGWLAAAIAFRHPLGMELVRLARRLRHRQPR